MNVFLVLSEQMGGTHCKGVYLTREKAKAQLTTPAIGQNPEVVKAPVRGEQPDPNVVYIAECYDRSLDVHFFEGIYGNRQAAEQAAGPQGMALSRQLS